MAWGGPRPTSAAKTTMPSPPARACFVGRWPVLHGATCALAAHHGSQTRWSWRYEAAAADLGRCRRKRASANGVGCGASRVAREDNRTKSASARVLRRRSAGFPRGEARSDPAARESNAVATTLRSRSRRPDAVSVRNSLGQRRWGRPHPALTAKTTMPSPPANACFVGRWPVLHGAKRALAARHGSQTRWS